MKTMLECYKENADAFHDGMLTAMPSPQQTWAQMETLYRMDVLETCQMIAKTAPRSAKAKELEWHYQMFDAYFQCLATERRYGGCTGEGAEERQDSAHASLLQVIQDYRRRFGSFAPGSDDGCYRKTVSEVVRLVLIAWIQYRQTYIEINMEDTSDEQQ